MPLSIIIFFSNILHPIWSSADMKDGYNPDEIIFFVNFIMHCVRKYFASSGSDGFNLAEAKKGLAFISFITSLMSVTNFFQGHVVVYYTIICFISFQ